MNVSVYDKSFEGLLSVVFDAYSRRVFPERLLAPDEPPPLIALEIHRVHTTEEKAERVYAGLQRRLSLLSLNKIALVWFSECAGCDELLFRFMRAVFDNGPGVETNFANPDVAAVRQLARQVGREGHHVRSFVRFQKTSQDVYFAPVAPKYNVIRLMMPHFAERFHDQRLIIYDTERNFGLYHGPEQKGVFSEVFLEHGALRGTSLPEDMLAENEILFQELWKKYVQATAVRERLNPKLQMQFMPRRYWQYLTEKQPFRGGSFA